MILMSPLRIIDDLLVFICLAFICSSCGSRYQNLDDEMIISDSDKPPQESEQSPPKPRNLPENIVQSQVQSQVQKDIQRIAVLSLKDQTQGMIKEAELVYLSNLIRQAVGLLPQDQYPVMTQENIIALLPEGKKIEDCIKDCEISIGRELGAHYVITGEVLRFADSFKVLLQLHESKSGLLKNSDSLSGLQLEDLEKMMKGKTLGLFVGVLPDIQNQINQINQNGIDQIAFQASINLSKIKTRSLSSLEEIDLPTTLKFEIRNLDYENINVNALEAYDKAVLRESQFEYSPQSRKEAWEDLLKIEKNSQLALLAQERVDALEKIVQAEQYHQVKRIDQSNYHPVDKIEYWKSLLNHPKYQKQAQKRIEEWQEVLKMSPVPYFSFEEIYRKLSEQHVSRNQKLKENWEKLSKILSLKTISSSDQSIWVNEFIQTFGVVNPLNPYYDKIKDFHTLPLKEINRIQSENLEELKKTHQVLKSFPLEFWHRHSDHVWDALPNEMIEAESIPLPYRVFPTTVSIQGVEFIRIDGGVFLMGTEKIRTRVKPFYMSKTEITVAQYQNCVDAGVCKDVYDVGNCNWNHADRKDHPINCIPFFPAKQYAEWLKGHLPSAQQWEYAARSQGQFTYPWGNTQENCDLSVLDCDDHEMTSKVCSRPSGHTKQGLCDMMGNVSEWLLDRSLRGSNIIGIDGEWPKSVMNKLKEIGDILPTTSLSFSSTENRFIYVGFRVVLNIATSF